MRKLVILLTVIMIFSLVTPIYTDATNRVGLIGQEINLTAEKVEEIEAWIEKYMKKGNIPGTSVVIVQGDKTIYNKGFGHADVETKKPVTSQTLFEIGSTSKAYTGLAILKLEEEGLINLKDPVTKYIPWLQMKYEGLHRGVEVEGYVDITIEQFLYQTSGVPFKTIATIPAEDGDDALENTVRTLLNYKLDFYPGTRHEYATINYDVLGLVVEKVTGIGFEEYVINNILAPLGLDSTFLFRADAESVGMATGYKLSFKRPRKYNAPVYRGNTPAGYFITNGDDVSKWLKIQLGSEETPKEFINVINKSHIPDRSVAPTFDGSSYAAGWAVYQDGGGEIAHGGSNPNFSSFFMFRPDDEIGVAVLSNANTLYTDVIAKGITNILINKKPNGTITDMYISIDNVSVVMLIMVIPVALVTIYLLGIALLQIASRKRRIIIGYKKALLYFTGLTIFLVGFTYCLYRIPYVLFGGMTWNFAWVWASPAFIYAIIALLTTTIVFSTYFVIITVCPKEQDRSYFAIVLLSSFSGLANALIIFIINAALVRTDVFQTELLLLFVLAIVIYVFGQRMVRIKLLTITNEVVYSKRTQLINKVLNAPFANIDNLEDGKIQAGLNNDAETISNFANVMITALTGVVTLISCFIYLGMINLVGLLVSIVVIAMAAGMFMSVSNHADTVWQQTRDTQNEFFKYINHMLKGFKELRLNKRRRIEFETDMQTICKTYRDKRTEGDLGFANAFVIGELLFTFVIGVVAFIFPIIFKEMTNVSLRNYIFIFLYMTGPVNAVLNSIPVIVRVRISHNRLKELINELELISSFQEVVVATDANDSVELALKEVEYTYEGKEGETFTVGPIDLTFRSGEITFITGGNGSGKSTLAKLITGLYEANRGSVLLNGSKVKAEELEQQCSAIFSDFYLFDKLYGIDHKEKLEYIQYHLKNLGIEDKLSIEDGMCSTIKLSTGQKKRLALMISLLEDRPIYLLDEWAADQDPEFRYYFYNVILPELREKNKCVIAITHDDRYFNLADNIVKMNMGKLEYYKVGELNNMN